MGGLAEQVLDDSPSRRWRGATPNWPQATSSRRTKKIDTLEREIEEQAVLMIAQAVSRWRYDLRRDHGRAAHGANDLGAHRRSRQEHR
jgi:hypothetical protein